MITGFTGTRKGMTPAQKASVNELLDKLDPELVHHGGCIGADTEFHELLIPRLRLHGKPLITIHPSNIKHTQGQWEIIPGVAIREELPPLVRDRIIVNLSKILIATPKGTTEERRSGTWTTVRYARKKGHTILFIIPNGDVQREDGSDE